MKILLVDDDEMVAQGISLGLSHRGHTVIHESSAIAGWMAYTGKGPFDIVITDWQMPGKDGIWLVEHIRDYKETQPILMQSAEPDGAQKLLRRSQNRLVNDIFVLGKPYAMKRLMQCLGCPDPEPQQPKIWRP